ncbi:DUF2127 domain-containing protein, partial [Psychrobacter celer]
MANLPRSDDRLPPSVEDGSSHVPNRSQKPASTASESIKAVAIYEVVKGAGAIFGAGALWSWHARLEYW